MNENSVASTHKPIDYRVVQVWPTEERQFYLYEQGALGRSRREQVA